MTKNTFLNLLLLIGVAVVTVQCEESEDGNTKEVGFTPIPAKPIVIASNFTYLVPPVSDGDPLTDDGDPTVVTVQGPWFQFAYTITNNSDLEVTIQTMKFTITGVNSSGNETTFEKTLDSGKYPVNLDASIGNDQRYLVYALAGETVTPSFTWYIDGLPESENLSYNLKVEVIGWFGSPWAPFKSFKKEFTYTTAEE